ncbi:MAG: MOSC domain-containing protein [bacterium]|nr:MOSC domain-containing protein [bacterium]
MNVTISELWIYPIKSCGGIPLDRAEVQARGFAGDRRFMVVDSEGRFLSQRTLPAMARIRTRISGARLILSTIDSNDFDLPITGREGCEVKTTVWNDTCRSIDQGEDAARWFSQVLETDCRLVFMPDPTLRPVDQEYGRPPDTVSFADGYPFLLISQGSLDELNQRLERPVPMNRFRPNIVVSGCPPYAEDDWLSMVVGDITFLPIKPCSRCVVITTDQTTCERYPEPLRTLATYRQREGKVLFGQNLVHDGIGQIEVGNSGIVITKKAAQSS